MLRLIPRLRMNSCQMAKGIQRGEEVGLSSLGDSEVPKSLFLDQEGERCVFHYQPAALGRLLWISLGLIALERFIMPPRAFIVVTLISILWMRPLSFSCPRSYSLGNGSTQDWNTGWCDSGPWHLLASLPVCLKEASCWCQRILGSALCQVTNYNERNQRSCPENDG